MERSEIQDSGAFPAIPVRFMRATSLPPKGGNA
jgi:hypothetical protein